MFENLIIYFFISTDQAHRSQDQTFRADKGKQRGKRWPTLGVSGLTWGRGRLLFDSWPRPRCHSGQDRAWWRRWDRGGASPPRRRWIESEGTAGPCPGSPPSAGPGEEGGHGFSPNHKVGPVKLTTFAFRFFGGTVAKSFLDFIKWTD